MLKQTHTRHEKRGGVGQEVAKGVAAKLLHHVAAGGSSDD